MALKLSLTCPFCTTWCPTWDVVFLEDGKVLLSDSSGVLQGDVVNLAADAFHEVSSCGRDVGATLPPAGVPASPGEDSSSGSEGWRRRAVRLLVLVLKQALLLTSCVTWTNPWHH